jgi:hypothetical protein
LGIEMVFGLGDKIQSSSWLLNKLWAILLERNVLGV